MNPRDFMKMSMAGSKTGKPSQAAAKQKAAKTAERERVEQALAAQEV